MIRAHFFDTQHQCLVALTEQLFKLFNSMRFVEADTVGYSRLLRNYNFLPKQNIVPIKQRQFPPPLLGLPGGETGKQLAKLWSEEYADCDLWHKIHYYWTEEECVPADNADSCFGSMRNLFFDKLDIDLRHIHPIHGEYNPDDEVIRYEHTLCRTRGISYDPALYPDEAVTPFEAYYHCAIIDVDDKGNAAKIRSFHNEYIEVYSIAAIGTNRELDLFDPPSKAPYFVRKNRSTGRQHISVSMRTLMKTPRILIPLFGKDKASILYRIDDFFNPPSALSLLRQHPNVHLYIVNEDFEESINSGLKITRCHFQYELDQLLQETD